MTLSRDTVVSMLTRAMPRGTAAAVATGIEREHAQWRHRGDAFVVWWFPEPGTCEVIAACGDMRRDGDWMLEAIGSDMRRWGATHLTWTGERPWQMAARRVH